MIDTAPMKSVEAAMRGTPVLVLCKGAATADAIFSSVLELTALMFRIVIPRERTVWFGLGGKGAWIRVRCTGQETPAEGTLIIEVK